MTAPRTEGSTVLWSREAAQGFLQGFLADAFAALATNEKGLTSGEAAARLLRHGPNRVEERRRRRLILDFLRRFLNPLTLILLAAASVSAATRDPTSFLIIIGVVLLSVTLDFVQECRAENAAEKLRSRIAITVAVRRDGELREIPATEIVPGDIIALAAGDLIPADCRIIESKDLFVNEGLLTGESFPTEKQFCDGAPSTGETAVPANALCAGTSVVSGTATALAVATGRATRFAAIAHSLLREPPPTSFALGMREFGLLIVRVTVLLVLFVLLVNLLLERPLLESFLFALALAVGLTPELLPMVVTVTLAHGAIRMSRKQVIVKRLSAIHDLGSMDVLCSDKTGTLTEDRIKLIRELDPTGAESRGVLQLAYLNAAFETGLKSPLDVAILETKGVDLSGWRKIDEVPFDFERRRVSVLIEKDRQRRLVVKGAPEDVLRLASCYRRESDGAVLPLDAKASSVAQDVFERLSGEGFRVLGVAFRDVEPDCAHAHVSDETDLIFAGFAAFLDPPKISARPALEALARLGVRVKIVTGDSERVTQYVCRELGIETTGLLMGPELAAMSDEALSAQVERVDLFCRITPPQKARIIQLLRQRGHVVGFLGDGINDAPSLQAADVGLSVDTAVDVARAAATMILLEKDLGVLAEGVREGRRTFANIMKYVMMGTSSNFGNMFSMAAGVLFLPFLPLLPVQILLNNLLYDLSETAIPLDRVDEEMLERPRRWDIRSVRDFMLVLGPVSSCFDFLTFGVLMGLFHANEALFHTGWFIESVATQVLVIFVIRTRRNPLASRPHRLLVASAIAALAVAVILPYTAAGVWIGFVPPPPLLLLAFAGMTVVYLLAVWGVRNWFFARHPLATSRP